MQQSTPALAAETTTIGLPAPRLPPREPVPSLADYHFVKVIGRGAFGTVWLAEEKLSGALLAVKVLQPPPRRTVGGGTPTGAREAPEGRGTRIERELEGLHAYQTRAGDHQHLVRVLKTGTCTVRSPETAEGGEDGSPRTTVYYVMEIADHARGARPCRPGDYEPLTLQTLLRQRRRLPATVADSHSDGRPEAQAPAKGGRRATPLGVAEISLALLDAIDHLHKAGIQHRDIKSANILLVDGVVKLADIGLTASADQDERVGTPGYLPPEGKPNDLYSLGKVMYEMLTGLPAAAFPEWPGDWANEPRASARAEAGSPNVPLSAVRRLINRLCHPSDGNRLADASACCAELLKLLTPPRPPVVTRRAALLLTVAIPLAAVASGLSVQGWHDRRDPTKRRYGQRPVSGSETLSLGTWDDIDYEMRRLHQPGQVQSLDVGGTCARFFDLQSVLREGRVEVCGAFQIFNRTNPIITDIDYDRGEINQLWLMVFAPDSSILRADLLFHGQPGAEPGIKAGFGLRRSNAIPVSQVTLPTGVTSTACLVLTAGRDPDEVRQRVASLGTAYLDQRMPIAKLHRLPRAPSRKP